MFPLYFVSKGKHLLRLHTQPHTAAVMTITEQQPGLHHRSHAANESSEPADVEAAVSSGSHADKHHDSKDIQADASTAAQEPQEEQYADVTYGDIFKQFSILGWTAFGGPAAHIGLFQRRLVERLRWMSDEVYGELFALGQCMPGPTSTQVSFAIGVVKKGVRGE